MVERITKRWFRQQAARFGELAQQMETGAPELPFQPPDAVTAPYKERALLLRAIEAAFQAAAGDRKKATFELVTRGRFEVNFT